VGTHEKIKGLRNWSIVSIQLVSPASGDLSYLVYALLKDAVSIQLVSPASGDSGIMAGPLSQYPRFHSISFPSEWGQIVRRQKTVIKQLFPFN